MENEQLNLLTVDQFCKKHSWPPPGGMRWMIFKAKENGLSPALIRIGRRVLIDVDAFFKWAYSHSVSDQS